MPLVVCAFRLVYQPFLLPAPRMSSAAGELQKRVSSSACAESPKTGKDVRSVQLLAGDCRSEGREKGREWEVELWGYIGQEMTVQEGRNAHLQSTKQRRKQQNAITEKGIHIHSG